MAKEKNMNSKKIQISKAQQYMIFAVLGAGIITGAAAAAIIHFTDVISFNTRVIMAKDEAIVSYSDTIKNIGICVKPKGSVYTHEELKACNPNSTSVDVVPGTLRFNILNNLAANPALNSVQRDYNDNGCVNPETGKSYTYEELNALVDEAEDDSESVLATTLMKSCSALRIVADALPAYHNEEALLASLDKIFILSDAEPESLSPTGEVSMVDKTGINNIMMNIVAESAPTSIYSILTNIERSIRNFNIERAMFEWVGENNISLSAKAAAYYVDESELVETSKTIPVKATDTKKKGKTK